MKKIMFNDNFGLTKAVLEGRKTMTRRIIDYKTLSGANDYVQRIHGTGLDFLDYLLEHSRCKVGERIAVAQSYSELSWDARFYETLRSMCERLPQYELAGWDNKMFVRADLMPHRIRITDIKVEHLQGITEEDCMREGIEWCHGSQSYYVNYIPETGFRYWLRGKTIREAFAFLIDKVSGKGTWAANPWVFVYSFELVV